LGQFLLEGALPTKAPQYMALKLSVYVEQLGAQLLHLQARFGCRDPFAEA